MDFSDAITSSGKGIFSPEGNHLVHVRDQSIVFMETETLETLQVYPCADKVNQLEWSADSKYVLCAMHGKGIVQVWSLESSQWRCRIDEGAAGISFARWSPDGRHVLTVADFQVRVAVRSLVTKTVKYLPGCKFGSRGLCFSNNGSWLALLLRHDCKDSVAIFSASDEWEQCAAFEVDTADAAGISWCPDNSCLAVWDNPLNYHVKLFSIDGSMIGQFSAYDNQLGIKSVMWAPSGQFLSLGSFDGVARVLNNVSWKTIAEYQHQATVNTPMIALYSELGGADASEYVVHELPSTLPMEPGSVDPSKLAVSHCSWSPDSRYMFTRCEAMPRVLWIWETLRLALAAVVVQRDPITMVKWAPSGDAKLAMCSGNAKVYLWSPRGCSCVDIPSAGADAGQISWSQCLRYILLQGARTLCICYIEAVDF